MTLRLGTRRSPLATAQATLVADRLRAAGHEVELVFISTFGDRSAQALTTIGGTGVFAAAIRQAVLDGEVDVAVHSLKDLPVTPEPGLVVAAVPPRDDPRDVLVARDGLTLGELPVGSVVGTGSPRRTAQLLALGLGLDVRAVRGNVGTRLDLVGTADEPGKLDAVVLARAGLVRLGRLDTVTETLDPIQMLPAPGQGALAVECREDRPDVRDILGGLDDDDTRVCVTAERALLAALQAGCTAPVGALAEIAEGDAGPEIFLRGVVASPDGAVVLRRSVTTRIPEDAKGLAAAESAGRSLADLLLEDGAADLTTPPDGIPRPAPTFSLDRPLDIPPHQPPPPPTEQVS